MSSYDNNFHKLTNGVLYLNGNSTYGKTEEINNPVITAKMIEHKVAGMVGTVHLSSGYDKMEGSFKLNGPVPEIASAGADVFTTNEFIFKGNLQKYKGQSLASEVPYTCIWRGTFKESPGGNVRQHENMELNYQVSVNYFKLVVDGVTRFEIDFINNILIIDGVDKLAKYRKNTGLA